MTKEEFDTTQFRAGMKCYYRKYLYHIKGIDFFDNTIWIFQNVNDEGRWITYQEVEIVK